MTKKEKWAETAHTDFERIPLSLLVGGKPRKPLSRRVIIGLTLSARIWSPSVMRVPGSLSVFPVFFRCWWYVAHPGK